MPMECADSPPSTAEVEDETTEDWYNATEASTSTSPQQPAPVNVRTLRARAEQDARLSFLRQHRMLEEGEGDKAGGQPQAPLAKVPPSSSTVAANDGYCLRRQQCAAVQSSLDQLMDEAREARASCVVPTLAAVDAPRVLIAAPEAPWMATPTTPVPMMMQPDGLDCMPCTWTTPQSTMVDYITQCPQPSATPSMPSPTLPRPVTTRLIKPPLPPPLPHEGLRQIASRMQGFRCLVLATADFSYLRENNVAATVGLLKQAVLWHRWRTMARCWHRWRTMATSSYSKRSH